MLATRLLTATIVTGLCLQSASAQTLPPRQTPAPAASSPAAPPITPTEEPSFWDGIPLPKITMPKITMPKMPTDPFAPVKASAHKVSAGAKKAWEGTREILSFGSGNQDNDNQTRVASRPKPSIWSRMFSTQPPENNGPQTISEFMANERPM